MELKKFFEIFRKQTGFFWSVVLIVVALAILWQVTQPEKYQASLLLNIGRSGTQTTTDYTYDSFYRLQADERFADTVVRWLGDPRVVTLIFEEAGVNAETHSLRELRGAFGAGRLSSQMIEVHYGAGTPELARDIADSVTQVLNRFANRLNREAQEESWFLILGEEPVVRDGRTSLDFALALGMIAGLFLAFWAVLIRNYLSNQ